MTPEAGRVLGCLVEKELTTPQQYPLTANALLLACNQTTNRDPVVTLDDDSVTAALGELKELRLVRFVLPSHGRSVTRYRHVLDDVFGIDVQGVSLLGVLLLHGPQTPGELRTRAGRMAEFANVDSVNEELVRLTDHPDHLAVLVPKRPGQKEDRWEQLLAARWEGGVEPAPDLTPAPSAEDGFGNDHRSGSDELADLRAEVASLRSAVAELDAALTTLRQNLGE
jgi:uncharacterized protein YceH (UPF0502 family)